jgi:predicted glycoside hydrolase/deacetylase ChbG (UPF0249 family)
MSALAHAAEPSRALVVNGDDFGRSPGINRGILECFDRGILTSASLMTVWPSAAAAAAAATARPRLGIGLHVDLGEWEYAGGEWACTYLRVALDDEQAVGGELDRQLRAFRRLLDRDPTHLDSHQHVHRQDPVRSVLAELAGSLGIPLRHYAPALQFRGEFFGQTNAGESRLEGLSVDALVAILDSIGPGTTELGCHPGYADDLRTAYRKERAVEVETLCDPRVRAAISKRSIRLCSFAEVAALSP